MSFLNDDSVWKENNLTTNTGTGVEVHTSTLYEITDGIAFKNNELFNENSNAFRVIVYRDAFELCNPLGSCKKNAKL